MEKDSTVYLRLMLDATRKIHSFIVGMNEQAFLEDSKTQSAVIMQLQVIGELSKKIPDSIKVHIDVPWKDIAGLRDVVSHDYFSLDLKAVWQTATHDVVELEGKIDEYFGA